MNRPVVASVLVAGIIVVLAAAVMLTSDRSDDPTRRVQAAIAKSCSDVNTQHFEVEVTTAGDGHPTDVWHYRVAGNDIYGYSETYAGDEITQKGDNFYWKFGMGDWNRRSYFFGYVRPICWDIGASERYTRGPTENVKGVQATRYIPRSVVDDMTVEHAGEYVGNRELWIDADGNFVKIVMHLKTRTDFVSDQRVTITGYITGIGETNVVNHPPGFSEPEPTAEPTAEPTVEPMPGPLNGTPRAEA